MKNFFNPTPWDSVVFGMETYEILTPSIQALELALQTPGHYTIKVDPLISKKILHDFGFYYCDTLIEPYCDKNKFIFFENDSVDAHPEAQLNDLITICQNAFLHGRFHRDFNIDKQLAEQRYSNWIKQLYHSKSVYELNFQKETSGFIAIDNNKLVLHAIIEKYRGKGLAKFFWSKVCKQLFDCGFNELTSSVSATNLSVVNLYASLGFRFRNPVDIYHRLVCENK